LRYRQLIFTLCIKLNILKLAALFAKFLYQHKELRLPGIGVFTLDPSVTVPDVMDKNSLDFTQHIKYSQVPVAHADESFINFIRTETGKIRPLAESDLDSFLSDGKILLNIGKPFHFEGIGYLQKSREGRYEFTPGDAVLPKPTAAPIAAEDEGSRSRSVFTDDGSQPNTLRKTLIGAGAVIGIILVIWLGYSLYHRNTNGPTVKSTDTAATNQTSSGVLLDSVQSKIDSVRNEELRRSQDAASTYRFVIERTANRERAYRRFNQIKENLTDVKLESRDSTLFTLYFVLPARASDTARIRDSLKVWYGRKRVWVENSE
jgi:hypothetical protein